MGVIAAALVIGAMATAIAANDDPKDLAPLTFNIPSQSLATALQAYSAVTGTQLLPDGNRHAEMAPHNCYPCTGGDWISVAVADETQWHQLCRALDAGSLVDDERYSTLADRLAHTEILDLDVANRQLVDENQALMGDRDALRAPTVAVSEGVTDCRNSSGQPTRFLGCLPLRAPSQPRTICRRVV